LRFFLHTSRQQHFDKGSNGLLVGFPNGHVYWNATEFLMSRAKTVSVDTSYCNALYLVKFFNYLFRITALNKKSDSKSFERKINAVTSNDLDKYFAFLQQGKDKIQVDSANQNLSAVVGFFWWLQINSKTDVKYLCGWADTERGIPAHQIKVLPGEGEREYRSPYRKRVASSCGPLFVPTRNHINLLSELVLQRASQAAPKNSDDMEYMYRIRNLLVFDWMSQAGLRSEETRLLQCETIEQALEQAKAEADGLQKQLAILKGVEYEPKTINKMFNVLVKHGAKNDKQRMVQVTPDLLERTLSYISFERKMILKVGHCKDSGEVFVTTANKRKNSSARMSDTYISSIVTFELSVNDTKKRVMGGKISKPIKTTPHALRRYAITSYGCLLLVIEQRRSRAIGRLSDTDYDNMLNKLKRFAGHKSADTTLQYYFDLSQSLVKSKLGATRAEIEYQKQILATLESELI
jgi:integrase